MPFSAKTKEDALLKSRRYCCICRKFAGRNIEVHHILPEADGGPDTLENAIPLCFDCHADAGHYNPAHPRGNKYSPDELRSHRDAWWKWCSENPFTPLPDEPILVSPALIDLRAGKWKANSRLKIHNRTNEIFYQIFVILALDTPNIDLHHIQIKRTKAKDELVSNLGKNIVSDDVMALGGTDNAGKKVILLRLAVLDPQETRTFSITNNSPYPSPHAHQPKAIASVGCFFNEPGQVQVDEETGGIAMSFQLPIGIKLESLLLPIH